MADQSFSRRQFVGILGGAAVATFLIGCSTTKTSDQAAEKKKLEDLRATKKYLEKNIAIGDNFFDEKETTIEAGTIVIWTNEGNIIHDVMVDDPDDKRMEDFSSDTLRSGNIHVVLFEEPGKYFYHCHFHGGPQRGQWGSITVNPNTSTVEDDQESSSLSG